MRRKKCFGLSLHLFFGTMGESRLDKMKICFVLDKMLIEDLNKTCVAFVQSLATTFSKNASLQMVKTQIELLPADSPMPLHLISTYLLPHIELVKKHDEKLFDHDDLKDQVQTWNVKKMYSALPRSAKDELWNDLNQLLNKVKIIRCAGGQLNGFEQMAQQIVDQTGIKDIPKEDRNMPMVFGKVYEAYQKNPAIANGIRKLMENMNTGDQTGMLKEMGLDHLIDQIADGKELERKISMENHAGGAQGRANTESLNDDSGQVDNNAALLDDTEGNDQPPVVSPSPEPTSDEKKTQLPASPIGFSDMNKVMFQQLAQQFAQTGELDNMVAEAKSFTGPGGEERRKKAAANGEMPPAPPFDIQNIMKTLTAPGGLMSSFAAGASAPKKVKKKRKKGR